MNTTFAGTAVPYSRKRFVLTCCSCHKTRTWVRASELDVWPEVFNHPDYRVEQSLRFRCAQCCGEEKGRITSVED